MNWVHDKEWDARHKGYTEGYQQAAEDAERLVASENLVQVAAWLKSAMKWKKAQNTSVVDINGRLNTYQKSLPPKPVLREHLQNVTTEENVILDAESERLKRAAPAMLDALRLLHALLAEGVDGVRKYGGEKMTVLEIARVARIAIEHAEK